MVLWQQPGSSTSSHQIYKHLSDHLMESKSPDVIAQTMRCEGMWFDEDNCLRSWRLLFSDEVGDCGEACVQFKRLRSLLPGNAVGLLTIAEFVAFPILILIATSCS